MAPVAHKKLRIFNRLDEDPPIPAMLLRYRPPARPPVFTPPITDR
jgi:hypothetical protein